MAQTNIGIMKYLILIAFFFFFSPVGYCQSPQNGTFTFRYCDLEYNKCISTCTVIVKGNKVIVRATKDLANTITGIKEADIIEQGTLKKVKNGVYKVNTGNKSDEPFSTLNFNKKEFWRL